MHEKYFYTHGKKILRIQCMLKVISLCSSVGDPHWFSSGSRIADPDPLKIRADCGFQIADLAPSDIRRILQIRLPNADPYYIIKIESIFQGGMKVWKFGYYFLVLQLNL